MRFGPIEVKDKLGRTVILRNAEVSDSENLIKYMKAITAETPWRAYRKLLVDEYR